MKLKNRLLISVLMVVMASLVSMAQEKLHVVKVGDFKRLSLVDNINVNYRCNPDSAGLAVFTSTQEIANDIIFRLSDSGRLTIQVEDETERNAQLPNMTVYSSSLEEAENAGDSTLRLSGLPMMPLFKVRLLDNGKIIARNLRASKLELHLLSGKGKIIASGKCDELALRLVGTGEIQADQVVATDVSCRIMGTGSIGCHVDGGILKVNGSGTGKVYYKGTPSKVSVKKLGTIKAIPMK
ncbi:MAG: DUF2807 domain-containing protein [Muribaculaceae bacterium]|nr:DUF2807 domain-containing protein [Muribaculaceae bacterium]